MSRVGRRTIVLPEKVSAEERNGTVTVTGPKGSLSREFKGEITISITPESISCAPRGEGAALRALWGTTTAHLANMVRGVTEGYEKKLIIEGVGYRWEQKANILTLALGFSHPVVVPIPDGLTVTVEKNMLTVRGFDKELVGQWCARVRALKPVEPYKGKGIRYEGEYVRRKQGKKAIGSA